MTGKEWFKNAGFSLMIHWGLYSVLGGEWQGNRMEEIGEWVMSKYRIPVKEYEKLADVFNPIYFNADEWVELAKNAGMKYIVITAKHHDGFALYHSKTDSYNVVDKSPFKRDILGYSLVFQIYSNNISGDCDTFFLVNEITGFLFDI